MSAQASGALAKEKPTAAGRWTGVGLFLLFLALSLIVTLVGQMTLIPAQWRLAAKGGLALVFLAATVGIYRSAHLRPCWTIGLAYLAVALGFLLTFVAGRALPAPSSLTGSPIITLALMEQLTRTFGAVRAVDGLSLDVPAGSIFGFLLT